MKEHLKNMLRIRRILFVLFYAFQMSVSAGDLPPGEQAKAGDSSYLECGVLLGSPTFLNLSAGYWHQYMGLRVSGGYYAENRNGVQADLAYKLREDAHWMHSIGIALGQSQDSGCEYSYCGPVYNLQRGHLFLEFGVCKVFNVKRGDFSDLPYWTVVQVGCMHRFW